MLNSMLKSSIFVLVIGCLAQATVFNVPDDAATIQDAVDLCLEDNGDIVELTANTTYTGLGNRDIMLYGKLITVRSEDPASAQVIASTVIDCQNMGRAFALDMGETNETVIAGLTIRNGNGGSMKFQGGALYFSENSCAVVTNCVIENSNATYGGAIAVANYGLVTDQGSSPTIRNCQIIGNTAVGGGALYINGGNTVVENCVISNNSAMYGGAFYSHNPGSPLMSQCTVVGNTGTSKAGALYSFNASNLKLYGCILWDNSATTASQMQIGGGGQATIAQVSYCDIQGLDTNVVVYEPSVVQWGIGNIQTDPMFAAAETVAAPTTSMFAISTVTADEVGNEISDFKLDKDSPCVDKGDTGYNGQGKTDVYGIQRIFGEAVDIGASEFATTELIEAKLKLWPKAIKCKDRQEWFFCTIKLEDYETEDIDTESIWLQKTVQPVSTKKYKKVKELVLRFKMSDIRDLVPDSKDSIELTITGLMKDTEVPFEGSKKLKILHEKGKGYHKHDETSKKGKGHQKVEDSKDKKK